MGEVYAILKAIEDLYAVATTLQAAAAAKGDPTPQDVVDQRARSQAAQDKFDELLKP